MHTQTHSTDQNYLGSLTINRRWACFIAYSSFVQSMTLNMRQPFHLAPPKNLELGLVLLQHMSGQFLTQCVLEFCWHHSFNIHLGITIISLSSLLNFKK